MGEHRPPTGEQDPPAPIPAEDKASVLSDLQQLIPILRTFDEVHYGVELGSLSKETANDILTELRPLRDRIKALHNKMVVYVTDADFVHPIANLRHYDSRFTNMFLRLDACIQKHADKEIPLQVPSDPAPSSMVTGAPPLAPAPQPVSVIMIPEDEAPTFDGTLGTWHQWWDAYDRLVHSNTRYNTDRKFRLLLKSLQGDAKRLAGNPLLNEESYIRVINRLTLEYSNTSGCAKALKEKIRAIAPPANQHRDLRRFLVDFRNGLESFEIATNRKMSDDDAIELLTDLVPSHIKATIYIRQDSCELSYKEMFACLETNAKFHIKALDENPNQQCNHAGTKDSNLFQGQSSTSEAQDGANSSLQPSQTPKNNNSHGRNGKYKGNNASPHSNSSNITDSFTSVVPRTHGQVIGQKTNQCIFCGGPHAPSGCMQYPTLPQRTQRLHALNRCTLCFAHDHKTEFCNFSRTCHRCHAKHKVPVCPKNTPVIVNSMFDLPVPGMYGNPSIQGPSTGCLTIYVTH